MKKGLLAVVLAAICTIGLSGCDRVEPGYVGIKVNKLGEDKGRRVLRRGITKQ